jgi:Zn ribbon nucleic-acid-binding protein
MNCPKCKKGPYIKQPSEHQAGVWFYRCFNCGHIEKAPRPKISQKEIEERNKRWNEPFTI